MPHISKSQLEQLMSCPRLYYYERFEGVRRRDSLALVVGTCYHGAWERFFRHKLAHGENLPLDVVKSGFVDQFWDSVRQGLQKGVLSFEAGDDQKELEMGLRLVEAYFPYAEEIDPLAVEQHYELSIPGHDWTISGYIDLVYKKYLVDDDGRPLLDELGRRRYVPVVVDHKTANSAPYDPGVEGRYESWLAENRFNPEAIGYALAFRVLFGQMEDRFEYHHVTKARKPRVVISAIKVEDVQIRWYLDLAVEQIERIKRGFFERNLTSFRHSPKLCPAWNRCHGLLDDYEPRGKVKIV